MPMRGSVLDPNVLKSLAYAAASMWIFELASTA